MKTTMRIALAFGAAVALAPWLSYAGSETTDTSSTSTGSAAAARDDCLGQPGQTAADMPATGHQQQVLSGEEQNQAQGTGDIPATEHQQEVLDLPESAKQQQAQGTGDIPATEHQQQALDMPQSSASGTELQDIEPSSGSADDRVGQPGDTAEGMPATEHQKDLLEEPSDTAD